MPHLAFELDALKKVPDCARSAGLPEEKVGYGLVRMWGYCWSVKTDRVSRSHIMGFFGVGEPERLERALGAFEFVEASEADFRVKGAARYLRIAQGQSNGGKKASGNLKRGNVKKGGEPESLPGLVPALAGEEPEKTPGLLPAFHRAPSTEHLKELQQQPREAPKTKPTEPPAELLPEQLEAAAEIWRALEAARADLFGLKAKADPPETCRADLLKFTAAHKGSVSWALNTQAQWFERARDYVEGLDRKGKTEVLLKPSQWADHQGPDPDMPDGKKIAPGGGHGPSWPCSKCGGPSYPEYETDGQPHCYACSHEVPAVHRQAKKPIGTIENPIAAQTLGGAT